MVASKQTPHGIAMLDLADFDDAQFGAQSTQAEPGAGVFQSERSMQPESVADSQERSAPIQKDLTRTSCSP